MSEVVVAGPDDVAELVNRMIGGLADRLEQRPPLDACDTSYEFVKKYGLQIDGKPFDWEGYAHWRDGPYDDDHPDVVCQTGAQCGKSVYVMVRLLRAAIRRWGSMFGYYFPDYFLPKSFSSQRFKPFVMSSPELGKWLGKTGSQGEGTDQVFTRSFGASSIFFLSVAGKTSTEGLPMAGLFFDEVRRMSQGDIQRAEQRAAAQTNPSKIYVSTPKYPEGDINARFLSGDQRYWHTACDCPEGVVLSLSWPNCIADLRSATPQLRAKVVRAFEQAGLPYLGMTEQEREKHGEAAYICPKCGKIIVNPRDGWWEPHNPGVWVHSYQLPQLLLPTCPAAFAWSVYTNTDIPLDIGEFWNSTLGIPYVNVEARGVQPEHLRSCIETSLHWAGRQTDAWRRKYLKNTAMGIDAMGGFNCVVVKQRAPNGKYRTIHVEVLHGDDPWKQTAVLMHRYNVRVAVADCNPHWNEAHRFAKAFPGRAWLAVYVDEAGTKGKAPMVSWKDRPDTPPDQKGREVKFKHMVHINRTKGLQWSLARWKEGRNEVPDPRALVQQLPRQRGKVVLSPGLTVGHFEPVPIVEEVYFDHMTRIVFVKVYATEDAQRRGDFKLVAESTGGIDPHFAHANLYADMALSRIPASATEP